MTREERATEYAEHNQGKFTNEFGNLYHAYLKGAEEENAELEKENAEAKKLIKNIIRVTWGEGWNYDLGWKIKAEQFINEKFDYLKKDFINKSVDNK